MPVIVHIDMNSFFASCEVKRNPSLKGKKLIIGGMGRRSIVSAASYEAKICGIYTTMPMYMAKEKCPDAIFLPVDHEYYCRVSEDIFNYLKKKYAVVDVASIDEAYIDMSEETFLPTPKEYFIALQKEIYETLHIPCSIGVSYNRFLAKMASDYKKPLGITIIKKKDVQNLIWPIRIQDMYGCGKATSAKLNELGIMTIGDFVRSNDYKVKELVGSYYETMLAHAKGEGAERIIIHDEPPKSIGNSHTLEFDTDDYQIIRENIKILADEVSSRLRSNKMLGYTITLSLKDKNFVSSSKSKQIIEPTDDNDKILIECLKLLERFENKIIRLVGVSVSGLIFKEEYAIQLSLFAQPDYQKSTSTLIKQLNEIAGQNIFLKASELKKEEEK